MPQCNPLVEQQQRRLGQLLDILKGQSYSDCRKVLTLAAMLRHVTQRIGNVIRLYREEADLQAQLKDAMGSADRFHRKTESALVKDPEGLRLLSPLVGYGAGLVVFLIPAIIELQSRWVDLLFAIIIGPVYPILCIPMLFGVGGGGGFIFALAIITAAIVAALAIRALAERGDAVVQAARHSEDLVRERQAQLAALDQRIGAEQQAISSALDAWSI
jgi:hypothetical protein